MLKSRYVWILAALAITGLGAYGWWQSRTEPNIVVPETIEIPSVSVSELVRSLTNGDQVIVFDVRSKNDYFVSHIPNAVSMPPYELALNKRSVEFLEGWRIVLYCHEDACDAADTISRDLRLDGHEDVALLAGGFSAYAEADLATASQAKLIQDDLIEVLTTLEVEHVSQTMFADSSSEYLIIDARTPFEFVTGFIEGSINVPLYALQQALDDEIIPSAIKILVYDRAGSRSEIMTSALKEAGYSAVSLEGGINAWIELGNEASLPAADGSDLSVLMPLLER